MSYNILSPNYIDNRYKAPQRVLSWEYRRTIIIRELFTYKPDIICMQEVDKEVFDWFISEFSKMRVPYAGFWEMKDKEYGLTDGCCIFYNKARYQVYAMRTPEGTASENGRPSDIRVSFAKLSAQHEDAKKFMEGAPDAAALKKENPLTEAFWTQMKTKDNIGMAVCIFDKITSKYLLVANCHLYYSPSVPHVKAMQALLFMRFLETLVTHNQELRPALVLCGDFNSLPRQRVDQLGLDTKNVESDEIFSGVYELILTGDLPPHHKHHPYWRIIGAEPLCRKMDEDNKFKKRIQRFEAEKKRLMDSLEKVDDQDKKGEEKKIEKPEPVSPIAKDMLVIDEPVEIVKEAPAQGPGQGSPAQGPAQGPVDAGADGENKGVPSGAAASADAKSDDENEGKRESEVFRGPPGGPPVDDPYEEAKKTVERKIEDLKKKKEEEDEEAAKRVQDLQPGPNPFSDMKHSIPLRSAYKTVKQNEPPITHYAPDFWGTLDYIWYSGYTAPQNARVSREKISAFRRSDSKKENKEKKEEEKASSIIPLAVLELPTKEDIDKMGPGGCPNDKIPSDHLPLMVKFMW